MIFTTVTKPTAFAAAAAAVAFSTLFLFASPASAAEPERCVNGGVLLAGTDTCELVLTTGTATFTPTAQMTKLEVLLVGGGGSGADSNGNGYGPSGGGGGDVQIIDFSSSAATATPISLTAGASHQASTAVPDGGSTSIAQNGAGGSNNGGGSSGNNNPGGFTGASGGAGGGAGVGADGINGGAGIVVDDLASDGSLFSGDTNCYGGGGAVGGSNATYGTASCGGGYVVAGDPNATVVAPTANSGGGGGGSISVTDSALRQGASGIVVVRWTALAVVSVTFDISGHGAAVAPQSVLAGSLVTKPADPTAAGYVFNGWFSDAALTTPFDFSAPVSAATTIYASWSAVPAVAALAATGGGPNPVEVPLAIGALTLGLGFAVFAARRKRATR